jgi:nicotinamidase-related amidase
MTEDGLIFGDLGKGCAHICVDMQKIFGEVTDWHMPWFSCVLPNIKDIAAAHPEHTVFTRFIPARKPGEGCGVWQRYYERWASMTIERLGEEFLELVPELAQFVPPAQVFDKKVYGPWGTGLHAHLQSRDICTLVITGGETDICVLATVLGAVDLGYRVVLAKDALCSSSDETHDAMMNVYRNRYSVQIEIAPTNVILRHWR